MTEATQILSPGAGGEGELEQFPAHEDPMLESPILTEDPRNLTYRINELIQVLEWRKIARDNQEQVYDILRDLNTSKAQRLAEAKAMAPPEFQAPKTGDEAREIVGAALAKCYGRFQRLADANNVEKDGTAIHFGNVIVRLADLMKRLSSSAPAAGERS